MEVKITHLDQVKFAIHSRSHSILCDQPAENGGEDSGMTPPELLLASLGSCACILNFKLMAAAHLPGGLQPQDGKVFTGSFMVGSYRPSWMRQCPRLLFREAMRPLQPI